MEQAPTPTDRLEGMVAEAIEASWQSLDPSALLEAMTEAAGVLTAAFLAIGDEAYAALESGRDQPLDEAEELKWSAITFEWSAQAKGFLLLWRDVLFELQRARLLLADEAIVESRMERLRARSQQTLSGAAAELIDLLKVSRKTPTGQLPLKTKLLKKWRLQTNPWPAYREQMEQVPAQCQDLLQTHRQLMDALDTFHRIREEVRQMEAGCRTELEATESLIGRALELIEGEMEANPAQSLGKLAALLEDLEIKHVLPHHLNTFIVRLENQTEGLPEKLEVAVAVNGGILERKDVYLQRRAQQWLESEILPLLYESWEVTESVYNGLKMALVNIRNRALLLSAGNREGKAPDFDPTDLSQPLIALQGAGKQAAAELDNLFGVLEGRLAESFRLSLIYDTSNYFLPVPLQSTINQLQLNQNKWLVKLRRWFLRQQLALRRLRQTVEQEELMSVSEKVVRYIKHWQGDPDNQHYSSIFLTRGYIGESFAVGRRDELEHVAALVRHWDNGFRGSVAITGQRFSGKSLFGELLASRFFPENTVRLLAGEAVQVQGRKLKGGYDLREALEFIRKYTLNVRPLIWLDDLELWWEAGIPLRQNVRALIRFIDQYSNTIFFAISMSNSLREHLDAFAGIGNQWHLLLILKDLAEPGRYTVRMVSGDPSAYSIAPTCEGVFVR